MIRLVAIDLDGTLLPKKQMIPKKTVEVIQNLVAQGVYIVIASGRSTFAVESIQAQLGIQNQPIIMLNGVMIKYNETIKILEGIPRDVLFDTYNFCNERGYNFSAVLDDTDSTIANNNDGYTHHAHKAYNLAPEVIVLESLEKVIEHIKPYDKVVKINIMDENPNVITRATKEVVEIFGKRANVMRTGPWYVDYAPTGVDKGHALNILMKNLNIKKEETMAIGDSDNDLTMLKEVGTAVAVNNALDSVKEIADFITKNDNENEGVREALESCLSDILTI